MLSIIPNLFTLFRIIIIPFILVLFYLEESKFFHRLAFFLFILASITDFFDGYLARKLKLVTKMGIVLDPIADKLLVCSLIVMLVGRGIAHEVPCILIVTREVAISGLRNSLFRLKIRSLPVSFLSKVKTFLQMSSISLLLLGSKGSGIESLDVIANFLLWIASFITIFTGVIYFFKSYKYF